jgi:carbon starvation protein CstA
MMTLLWHLLLALLLFQFTVTFLYIWHSSWLHYHLFQNQQEEEAALLLLLEFLFLLLLLLQAIATFLLIWLNNSLHYLPCNSMVEVEVV